MFHTFLPLVLLGVGVFLLWKGATLMVDGSSSLALRLQVSPLLIGLTIVAYGTSVPELSVGVTASLGGHSELVIGNVVGSNIANILLILGLAAILCPIKVSRQTVKREGLIMVGVVSLVPLLALDGRFDWWEGVLLIGLFITYLVYFIREGLRHKESRDPTSRDIKSIRASLFMTIVGIGGIILGAFWIVDGAVFIAKAFGISEAIIGLTLVAFGTSVPELGAVIVAALRNKSDITLGNIVGSNIFNVLLILGVAVILLPMQVPASVMPSMGIMVLASAVVISMMWSGFELSKKEGTILLAGYLVYLVYLISTV